MLAAAYRSISDIPNMSDNSKSNEFERFLETYPPTASWLLGRREIAFAIGLNEKYLVNSVVPCDPTPGFFLAVGVVHGIPDGGESESS